MEIIKGLLPCIIFTPILGVIAWKAGTSTKQKRLYWLVLVILVYGIYLNILGIIA
ncbi:hypothetical protein [Clostridium neonatale]|uniref:hypothetical protein n=1 Tax=Clostridium neonatale TaxID=137838 RepID=UPI001B3720D6|nr:hypothetical protein [Clostridium neonatale]MBP8311234.1 hypothetical protein [Clostridium neonatale]CAG9705314.1 hypothetical protein CNEO_1180051 [Clostridium neonatale]CAI3622237.1 hypothetical protein CNEO3_280017 [Clostridium neonatale]CAI3625812.1 hypothetical protein CNEO3_270016 [Clostridium neonatale]CAI3637458.1 hypothetical protein CNEO3_290019 [Clostridium neonatale]